MKLIMSNGITRPTGGRDSVDAVAAVHRHRPLLLLLMMIIPPLPAPLLCIIGFVVDRSTAAGLPWMILWMLLLPSDATVRHLLLMTMIPPLEQSLLSSVTH